MMGQEARMEINRATTLAKVLAKERALEARDRKDAAIEKGRLGENDAYPGSKNFQEAVKVIAQYLEDLVEAKLSSTHDAHAQTGIPMTGQTVEDAMDALHVSLESVISARVGSWGGSLALVQQRTGATVAGSTEALAEAKRELTRQAAKLYERAEARLDVLLQTTLAASEKAKPSVETATRSPRVAAILRVLIASPSDVAAQREVLTNVVHDWNATHSTAEGIVLLPVKWESHAHPASGDYPQGIINKQIVDDCDLVIGCFWSRLGTATPVASSGTAEEIERLRSKGKKVLLYFSTAPLPQDHDHDQWQKLKEYQQTFQRDSLYWNYSTPEELRGLATRHLAMVIHELSAELGDASSEPPHEDRLASNQPEEKAPRDYDEEHRRLAQEKLGRLTEEATDAVYFLLHHGEMEHEQLRKHCWHDPIFNDAIQRARGEGLLLDRQTGNAGRSNLQYFWKVNPKFESVLQELLGKRQPRFFR
jgi:hypothetical protein